MCGQQNFTSICGFRERFLCQDVVQNKKELFFLQELVHFIDPEILSSCNSLIYGDRVILRLETLLSSSDKFETVCILSLVKARKASIDPLNVLPEHQVLYPRIDIGRQSICIICSLFSFRMHGWHGLHHR